ncbi:hypothetical protein ACGFMM_15585 [Streptomyces sp. NPDC048604]|uniref:hypothetical protein n=1 Tax=Streptomyces sp. NPDC048604 TaxID=3365578 RepID=UPI003722BD09
MGTQSEVLWWAGNVGTAEPDPAPRLAATAFYVAIGSIMLLVLEGFGRAAFHAMAAARADSREFKLR